MIKRVAYLTGRSYRGVAMRPGELPAAESENHRLLLEAGAERSLNFEIRYWDDPKLSEDGYDAALIRSCWDYTERADEFIATLRRREEAGLRIYNPSEVVAWNSRKTYLRDLGAAAIETIWVERADAGSVAAAFDALDAAEIVVKPQVGAGSVGTVRLRRNAWSEADLRDGPQGAAMIQPFLRAIETEGERSLFWFGGEFSHAIRKVPDAGQWRANIPGATRFSAEAPPRQARELAETVCAGGPAGMLYVRVDLVLGDDGRWRVIEIEAIEPHLFLDLAPFGAEALVRALDRALAG